MLKKKKKKSIFRIVLDAGSSILSTLILKLVPKQSQKAHLLAVVWFPIEKRFSSGPFPNSLSYGIVGQCQSSFICHEFPLVKVDQISKVQRQQTNQKCRKAVRDGPQTLYLTGGRENGRRERQFQFSQQSVLHNTGYDQIEWNVHHCPH